MAWEDRTQSLEARIGDLLEQVRELNLTDKSTNIVEIKNLINKRKQLLKEIKDLLSHKDHE
jgi:hypothetical protein